ncbi:hypothetical protein FWK35_00001937 [Aphis craccivora]|uniref:Uncharacterized protein n=1 Tax=Aphis craccivora TaxID=307492 RepID=A0A6G0Z8E4_APHCR|nr:hypothetical protein FWK35_00001937 [Aphis craccivora]
MKILENLIQSSSKISEFRIVFLVYKYLKKVKIFLKYKSCKENASLINW